MVRGYVWSCLVGRFGGSERQYGPRQTGHNTDMFPRFNRSNRERPCYICLWVLFIFMILNFFSSKVPLCAFPAWILPRGNAICLMFTAALMFVVDNYKTNIENCLELMKKKIIGLKIFKSFFTKKRSRPPKLFLGPSL